MSITRDDWLKAIRDVEAVAFAEDAETLTVREFGALIGLKREAAMARLEALIREGKAARVSKLTKNTRGALIRVTAYRLVT